MDIIDSEILVLSIDKNDVLSSYFARAQVGKSADNFYTSIII